MTRRILILAAFLFLGIFLLLPFVMVFFEAFRGGVKTFMAALTSADTRAALLLTLTVAGICLPLNLIFGIAAGWSLGKFSFPGRSTLISLIDLPLAVSPVVAGLLLVLLFGREGVLGPWLAANDIKIIFALPGIVLATLFVTFPFIARELIPVMQAQGREEEEAARVLGAGWFQTFFRVTLPNIKWGLMYGAVLSTGRAVGEFGAVSVVSGHIRGRTNTLPLHIEALYNEYQFQAAFAVSTLLSLFGLVSMLLHRAFRRRRQAEEMTRDGQQ